jgi:hypothetical protein
MFLHCVDGDTPSFHRVTLLAVGAELTPVKIGMAIGTPHSHFCKHHVRVALPASNVFMHTKQWIFGVIVVKFRNISDWFPCGMGVAIFARTGQRAVRAPYVSSRIRRLLVDCEHR